MRILLIFCGLLWAGHCGAQGPSHFQLGALPTVNLHHKLPHGWRLNFKVQGRGIGQEGLHGEHPPFAFRYALTDASAMAGRSVGLAGFSLAAGYLLRIKEGALAHRAIQQASLTQKLPAFKIAHRWVTDQTFEQGKPTVFRLRYRAMAAIPLSGEQADAGEAYLKIGGECLGIRKGSQNALEARLLPLMGYAFSDGNKLEIGFDYRWQTAQGDKPHERRYWLAINWYLTF